ncbi:MAG: hypothetical protein U0X87_14775 [Anaerolineales bacterium]
MPGPPIVYYGDEIGMADNIELLDRNGVRTPMQWDNWQTQVSRAEDRSLRIKLSAHQCWTGGRKRFAFHTIRRMIEARKKYPAFWSWGNGMD